MASKAGAHRTAASPGTVRSTSSAVHGASPSKCVMRTPCFSTSLGTGLVLWTPYIPTKDTEHTHLAPPPKASDSPVLVLLFTWLFCTPHAAARYVDLYTSKGWHVLHISSQLSHFLWPPCSKTFARDIAQVLRKRCAHYSNIAVHAMSIGAYNYTTCLMLADQHPDLHTYFFSKLCGVVFDSLTLGSLDHMLNGIATAVSDFTPIRTTIKSLSNVYFCLTQPVTVLAFNEGVVFFHNHPAPVRTFLIGSEGDPMCDESSLRSLVSDWRSNPEMELSTKMFENSKHCTHLHHNTEEYKELVYDFFSSVGLDPLPEFQAGQKKTKWLDSKL